MALSSVDALASAPAAAPESARPRRLWPIVVAVALVALAAAFASAPGRYIGDNRFELYWAPFDLLKRHLAVWDTTRGLGRPRWDYWPAIAGVIAAFRGVGLGPEVAERVWQATLLTTAGAGAAAVVRLFRPRVSLEHWLAAGLYAFGPFAAVYLVPTNLFIGHALAPWFLYCFVRGTRGGPPWRWAAVFALLIFVPGNMNYPALLFGAMTIVPGALYLVLVERSVAWRTVVGWLARAAVLSILVSAAAIVTVQASSAINQENLQLTETVREINRTSSWSESWRGLGFWGAYWGDSRGAILPQFARFFWWPVILLTFLVPAAALATLWRSRWRPRLLFGGILVLGLVLMVGAYPLDDPTPYGRALLEAFDRFPGILALRSGHKAGVLVALGTAALAGVALAAFVLRARARAGSWARPLPLGAAGAVAVVVLSASFPFWTGRLFSPDDGASALPTYWHDAARYLDRAPGHGRVLVLPSTALGAYTWGRTGDDILEGIIDRPVVARGLLSTWSGTDEPANLVAALDDYVNAGSYEPGVVGEIARRLGIEYVLVRNDLDWPATQRPRPSALDALRRDPGLELVRTFGAAGENVARPDAASASDARHSPIELYRVKDYSGVTRTDQRPPVVVSGDGAAWPGLAVDGLLTTQGPLRYSADAGTPELAHRLRGGSSLVVTDTNRRQAHEIPIFDSVARSSYTLAPGQDLPRESRELFDRRGAETVAHFRDATRISASSYGRPALPQPYDRPSNAFDGDPRTAWRIAPVFVDESSQWLRVDLRRPRVLDSVTVETTASRPTADAPDPMRIARLTAVLSDGTEIPVPLHHGRGQIDLPRRQTASLELRIDGVHGTDPQPFGIRDVRVRAGGAPLDLREQIQLPDDVARAAARDDALHGALVHAPVTYQLGVADRVDGRAVEPTLQRRFRTVGTRVYDVQGRRTAGPTLADATCRDLGIRVDGAPVPVRAGTTAGELVGCAPVTLDDGWHRVSTNRRSAVRRLWLSSGRPNGVAPRGAAPGATGLGTITSLGRADLSATARTSGPGLLVSGQSADDGWRATVDGHDAGAPVALDTQAAWPVRSGGEHRLDAHQSQTAYRIALAISAGGLVLCGFLVVRGRFR
jgi:arabinofuranan 3-O-arabinosyltransferase